MIKSVKEYECFPSINDLNLFISGCYYDSDQLYFRTGTWQLPDGVLYADDIAIKQFPQSVSGLGVFKDVSNEMPDLIFSHDWQEVFICDKTLLQTASKHLDNNVLFLEIAYDQAFEEAFDFESLFIDDKKETE